MFVDKATILVKAGNGGDGAVSFHREKYVAAGGPDGGDGGKGGDVILQMDTSLTSLLPFKYKRKYIAENGKNGERRRCYGKSAQPLIINVPKGTVVRERSTGKIIADISDGEPVTVAYGGKGGFGNARFATPTRQVPTFAKAGYKGDELELELELRLLADVGLVGFPNVGKSTLISVVSAAKPQIAAYPFTTLTPVLGVVALDVERSFGLVGFPNVGKSTLISVVSAAKPQIAAYPFTTLTPVLGVVALDVERSFVMADIPGLIEGAADGVGLGHEFLRHVDRCRLLIHVIDISGMEGREPEQDFEVIMRELERYSPELYSRPMLVVANKCELVDGERIAQLRQYIESKGYQFYEISAATTMGTRELMEVVYAKLLELPAITRYEVDYVPEEKTLSREITITVDERGVYVVEGAWLEHTLSMVNVENYENIQYMQRVLRNSGVIDKLEAMGIQEGETVSIMGFEFDYMT